ncbi:hypothetical protein HPB48_006950 [Haemaphysalis longicornis]|uniref:Uncharacterized protein n=1 Tax=Haemaphysalis longicornis TaxID=44386 RepID=A0A9J6GNQ7_HAELO|nr:hypothetical protein HPB48_006950 [Haemaphysalis longicornis]
MLDFCHLDPSAMYGELREGVGDKKWEVAKFEGSWVPGSTAGGSNDDMGTYTMPSAKRVRYFKAKRAAWFTSHSKVALAVTGARCAPAGAHRGTLVCLCCGEIERK